MSRRGVWGRADLGFCLRSLQTSVCWSNGSASGRTARRESEWAARVRDVLKAKLPLLLKDLRLCSPSSHPKASEGHSITYKCLSFAEAAISALIIPLHVLQRCRWQFRALSSPCSVYWTHIYRACARTRKVTSCFCGTESGKACQQGTAWQRSIQCLSRAPVPTWTCPFTYQSIRSILFKHFYR